MERRSFVRQAGLAGILAAGAAPAVVHAQANVRWRLTSAFPKALDTIYGAADTFAKSISDMSGGKFQISVHPSGELVGGFGQVDAVQNGTVEMTHTAPYYYFGKDPTFALGCAIPFGLNSRQMTAWMVEGNGLKLMREFYANYNIINFVGGNTGAQMGGWWRKEIKSLADIKGLKFRTGGFSGVIFGKLGGVAQSIPGGEIYQALEKGTIDAAEWVGPYDDEKLGFQKVAQYYYYPGFWEGGPTLHNFINIAKWETLPPSYKSLIKTASSLANETMQARYDNLNPAALKRLVGGGVQLKPFSPSIMEASLKAANEVYAETSATNPDFKKAYDSMAAYRSDQYLWWQVAEYAFDTFQIRSRTRG